MSVIYFYVVFASYPVVEISTGMHKNASLSQLSNYRSQSAVFFFIVMFRHSTGRTMQSLNPTADSWHHHAIVLFGENNTGKWQNTCHDVFFQSLQHKSVRSLRWLACYMFNRRGPGGGDNAPRRRYVGGVAIMPGLGGQTVVGGLSVKLKCGHLRSGAPRIYPILSYPRRRYVGGGGDNGDIDLSLPVIIVYDWGRLLNHDDNVGL